MASNRNKKRLVDQWKDTVAKYRRRHRQWTMEHLPGMSDKEWEAYETWVSDFGGMNHRKLKRQLRAARSTPPVTVTVTPVQWQMLSATRR